MQGKTHRVGGALCALTGFCILQGRGELLEGVNPLLQLTVMYPFALYGSVVSDLDHHWDSAPSKDPVSWVINKILHLTTGIRKKSGKKMLLLGIFDAKHRSWQTHSDLSLVALILLFIWASSIVGVGINAVILKMVFTGFTLGLISHLILDSITPEGIWFILPSILRRKKVSFHLVPKKPFFATGGPWERIIKVLMQVAIVVLAVYIIYILSPYRLNFNF